MWAIESQVSFRNLKNLRKELLVERNELLLIWEEHCTECFVPDCYSTCALYTKRYDGKCQRFGEGIKLSSSTAKNLSFKRWAKLESKFNVEIRGIAVNIIAFYVFFSLRNILFILPKSKIRDKFFGTMNHALYRFYEMKTIGETHNSFMLSIELKSDIRDRSLQLEIVNESGVITFKERVTIKSLVSSLELTIKDLQLRKGIIRITVDENADFGFSFYDIKLRLIGQILDNSDKQKHTEDIVKIVFWDLDNTIWDGILIEGDVCVRDSIKSIILRLNHLGIINVISSKNDFKVAARKLEELELFELFVGHQINWEPKSSNILELLNTLNLKPNNAVFVDDSAFERDEVKSRIPQIDVYDQNQILDVISAPKFNPPQSSESKNRIESYRAIIQREKEFFEDNLDYNSFLTKSKINLEIEQLKDKDLVRGFELLSRSNQLNFSGKKYTLPQFEQSASEGKWLFGRVSDRYGEYGKTILARIESTGDTITITDMTISCRIAKRNIEAAFFHYIFESTNVEKFLCNFVRTEKNQMLQQVLSGLDIEFDSRSIELQSLEIRDSEVLRKHSKVVTTSNI